MVTRYDFQVIIFTLVHRHHQSAVQDDLFDALNQHAGDKIPSNLNISDIMQGWTLQSGFPVLFVAAEGSQTTISQVINYIIYAMPSVDNISIDKNLDSRYSYNMTNYLVTI
jgi:aminopeptidase N